MQKRELNPAPGSRKYRLALKAIKRRLTRALAMSNFASARKQWREYKRLTGDDDFSLTS